MYIVYSTTKSFALYPVKVLIVAADPALAVNVPERLVVIPTSAPPQPPDAVTVTIPAEIADTSKFVEKVIVPAVPILDPSC